MYLRRALALAVMMLFMTSGLAVFGGAGVPPDRNAPKAQAPRAVDSNQIEWGDDVALTDNPVSDGHPQLAVSDDGACGVIWSRGGITSETKWMKVNSTGQALVPEKSIALSALPVQETGFLPPCIGVDSKGSYDIVGSPGGIGVYYSKLDSNGSFLVPWISVPSGAVGPRNPTLAVTSWDSVQIYYEDSRFGEDQNAIVYAGINNTGSVYTDGNRITQAGWNCTGPTICIDDKDHMHVAYIKTDQGVFHGWRDLDGISIPQAPDIFLYPTAFYLGPGPPSICCDPTGSVRVLWNDCPQSTGVLRFMKLDNYGNKLAAGPDGTGIPLTEHASCVAFPSIASDSDGNIYAAWSDKRDGTPQLYYLKIEPGSENDSELPGKAICLTNDTGGSAIEPNIAIGPDDNLHVVWMDNRGGNWEIFYKLGLNLRGRVKLDMPPEEMSKVMCVHLNQTVIANLTVSNIGNMADTINLSLDCKFYGHQGWNVSLGCNSLPLELKSSAKVTVSVTGPLAGLQNDYVDFFVTGVSASNPRQNSSLRSRSYLVTDQESFRLDCSDHVHEVPPGEPTVFTIMATNTGGWDIELNLTAEGPPDWIYALDLHDLNLEAGRSANFILSVTPPPYAEGGTTGIVMVVARPVLEPAYYKTVETRTVVSSFLSLEVLAEPAVGLVDPGETCSYTMTIWDHGNIREPLLFLAYAAWDNSSWNVTLNDSWLYLRDEESSALILNVTAPADALAGAGLVVDVNVSSAERDVSAETRLTAFVRAVGSIEASVTPGCSTAEPGGFARFSIDIVNRANHRVEVHPGDFNLPQEWNISFSLLDGSLLDGNRTLSLEVGGSASIIASVRVPAGALAGWYPIAGTLVDGAGQVTPVMLNAAVEQLFSLVIEAPAPAQSGALGEKLLFPLVVTNLGNGDDMIGFNWVDLPLDWPQPELVFPDGQPGPDITLGPSESANVTVGLRIPAATPVNSATIALYAESWGGIGFGTNLTIHVRKADLVITKVEPASRDLRAGAPVQVNVTVANRGEASAGTVVLEYFLNGRLVVSVAAGALPAGQERVERFTWVPHHGHNTLRFVADPANAVCESDETNNEAALERNVSTGTGPAPGNFFLQAAAASVVLVLVGLLLLGWRLRRPKRPSTLSV